MTRDSSHTPDIGRAPCPRSLAGWPEAAKALCAIAGAGGLTARVIGTRPDAVEWSPPGGQTLRIQHSGTHLEVTGPSATETPAVWGTISLPALDRGIENWLRNHPEFATGIRPVFPSPVELRMTESHLPAEAIGDRSYAILDNRQICDNHFLMDLEIPAGTEMDLRPGQFFMVMCDPGAEDRASPPLTLRRPLSIHRVNYAGFSRSGLAAVVSIPPEIREAIVRRPAVLSFLYRLVGAGTESLSRLQPGAKVEAMGPLGNGFSIGGERTAVIVSGGIGVAPLAALAEQLLYAGKDVRVYFGAVRGEMLALAVSHRECGEGAGLEEVIRSEFREVGAQVLGVCTDDGSIGAKGVVTELFEAGIRDGCVPSSDVCVYACGPRGMMRAVAEITARHNLPCQVSLEERMACGVGACYACTCQVVGPEGVVGRKRICREGPVFQAKDVQWKD